MHRICFKTIWQKRETESLSFFALCCAFLGKANARIAE
jgi:hypothetical protein